MISPAKILTLLVILPIALALDIVGIVLVCFGFDDFFITDIIGLMFIGGWFYGLSIFTTEESTEIKIPSPRRKTELKRMKKGTIKQAKWAKRIKWIRPLCICGEFIAYLGCFLWWTTWVLVELKYGALSRI